MLRVLMDLCVCSGVRDVEAVLTDRQNQRETDTAFVGAWRPFVVKDRANDEQLHAA